MCVRVRVCVRASMCECECVCVCVCVCVCECVNTERTLTAHDSIDNDNEQFHRISIIFINHNKEYKHTNIN